MNTIRMLNEALETKYHLNEAKEDKERFLSFINATIKDNIKSQSIVDNFDKLKSSGRIKGEEADYYYWIKNKTVKDLQDFLNAFNTSLSKTQTKKQEKKGAELIDCPNKDWVIYKIITYSASKYYGENTHWCITGRNGSDGIGAFNNYKQLGVKDYYFLWQIGDEANGKWCYLDYGKALQLNNDCFYDAQDDSHTINKIDIPDDVLLCLPGISQKLVDDTREERERRLNQPEIMKDVQKTGVYTYSPFDDSNSIRELEPKKAIVSDGVEELDQEAFYYYTSLQEITLPDGLERIGSNAFYYCKSLQKINIPNSVKYIGGEAFKYCDSLQEINLPNGLERIGNNAFSYCHSLQKINIPNSVKYIGEYAFFTCTSLQEITLFSNVKEIGWGAFYNCTSLKKINIKGEYRPKILKNAGLNSTVIIDWVDCGIKETWGSIKDTI